MENFSTKQKSQHPTNQQTKNFFGKLSNHSTLHKIFFLTHPITNPSPIYLSIHLLIHNIYQTYIIYSAYLPKRTPSETVGYGKCFKRHTSKHQQSHPIPLCPHPPSNKNPLSRSFSLNITNHFCEITIFERKFHIYLEIYRNLSNFDKYIIIDVSSYE